MAEKRIKGRYVYHSNLDSYLEVNKWVIKRIVFLESILAVKMELPLFIVETRMEVKGEGFELIPQELNLIANMS